MNLFVRWIISAAAIGITAYLLPGVSVENVWVALVVVVVLALVNVLLKPLIIILTLPINILTLGLFTFVINALLIMLVSSLVPGFVVVNFWWALLFSLILSLVNMVLKGATHEATHG